MSHVHAMVCCGVRELDCERRSSQKAVKGKGCKLNKSKLYSSEQLVGNSAATLDGTFANYLDSHPLRRSGTNEHLIAKL
jgi:hypothetical protein